MPATSSIKSSTRSIRRSSSIDELEAATNKLELSEEPAPQAAETESEGGEFVVVGIKRKQSEAGSKYVSLTTGKLRQLLTILRKAINVKDLSSLRISLPATLLEPIGQENGFRAGC